MNAPANISAIGASRGHRVEIKIMRLLRVKGINLISAAPRLAERRAPRFATGTAAASIPCWRCERVRYRREAPGARTRVTPDHQVKRPIGRRRNFRRGQRPDRRLRALCAGLAHELGMQPTSRIGGMKSHITTPPIWPGETGPGSSGCAIRIPAELAAAWLECRKLLEYHCAARQLGVLGRSSQTLSGVMPRYAGVQAERPYVLTRTSSLSCGRWLFAVRPAPHRRNLPHWAVETPPMALACLSSLSADGRPPKTLFSAGSGWPPSALRLPGDGSPAEASLRETCRSADQQTAGPGRLKNPATICMAASVHRATRRGAHEWRVQGVRFEKRTLRNSSVAEQFLVARGHNPVHTVEMTAESLSGALRFLCRINAEDQMRHFLFAGVVSGCVQ